MVKSKNGLLINDSISDHLPVFTFSEVDGMTKEKTSHYYKLVRDDKVENLNKFKNCIKSMSYAVEDQFECVTV